MKGKISLDRYEKQIESNIHSHVPIAGAKRRKIEAILDVTRKTRNVNIRINQLDLENLKRNEEQEGLPYQTLTPVCCTNTFPVVLLMKSTSASP
jgi:predicted DNA binding CopG/RHH family protein